ncbi:MAG: ribonuclease Z [Nitrososphaerota archaeon]|nr:ribonuclease Z [Nitrososphaerota archaeon]
MVKLTVNFLGTSSAAPTKSRGLPAIAIQREGEVILMDCGEGVQRQVMSAGIGLNRPTTILITHLHGDHVTGLLGLMQTMGMAQRSRPLTIVGPAALSKWLEVTSDLLNIGLTFQLQFVAARPGAVLHTRDFDIRAARADHSVESYAYLVSEKSRPGTFFPQKARRLGIPEGKLWSRLQKGRKVKLGGRTIDPSKVVGPRRPGRSIGYSGDTRPSAGLARFFSGCDLLIFDSTYLERDRDKAVERKHSTSREAALLARKAGVGSLALTHFSARYQTASELLKEARKVFPRVVAAHDGMKLGVAYPAG